MEPGGMTGGQQGRGTSTQEEESHLQTKPAGVTSGHWGLGAGGIGMGTN